MLIVNVQHAPLQQADDGKNQTLKLPAGCEVAIKHVEESEASLFFLVNWVVMRGLDFERKEEDGGSVSLLHKTCGAIYRINVTIYLPRTNRPEESYM